MFRDEVLNDYSGCIAVQIPLNFKFIVRVKLSSQANYSILLCYHHEHLSIPSFFTAGRSAYFRFAALEHPVGYVWFFLLHIYSLEKPDTVEYECTLPMSNSEWICLNYAVIYSEVCIFFMKCRSHVWTILIFHRFGVSVIVPNIR